jgi:DNA-binding IclR family transcriptional regulator
VRVGVRGVFLRRLRGGLNSRGYPMAVVNVWGPTPRNPVRKLHKMGREAVKTAEEIAKLLD